MCFHDGASDSPTACRENFGKEGTSQGGSRVIFHSSFPAVCNVVDLVVLEIGCALSSPRHGFVRHIRVPILRDKLFGTCHRSESKRVSIDKPIP